MPLVPVLQPRQWIACRRARSGGMVMGVDRLSLWDFMAIRFAAQSVVTGFAFMLFFLRESQLGYRHASRG